MANRIREIRERLVCDIRVVADVVFSDVIDVYQSCTVWVCSTDLEWDFSLVFV